MRKGGRDNTPLRYRVLGMTIIKWKTVPVLGGDDAVETAEPLFSFTPCIKRIKHSV